MITVLTGYKARYSSTGPVYGYVKSTETENLIPVEDYNRISQALRGFKGENIDTMSETGRVYFDKSALFPRHKFKEFKKNHVTRKVETADYVVIGKDCLENMVRRLNTRRYYKDSDGDWVETQVIGTVTNVHATFVSPRYRGTPTAHIEILDRIEKMIGKKIILDTDLNNLVPRDVNIRGELFDKLNKMLSSFDQQTVKVGVDILSNMDYNNNKNDILILLNRNYNNMKRYGSVYSVMFKSLLDVVEKDCPHWNNHNHVSFAMMLMENDPDNQQLKDVVIDHLHQYYTPKVGRFNVELIKDVEVQKQDI